MIKLHDDFLSLGLVIVKDSVDEDRPQLRLPNIISLVFIAVLNLTLFLRSLVHWLSILGLTAGLRDTP
jgi:hypothetical protein